MILYYSGAQKPNIAQNLSEDSLGGYVSSSIINNGSINNIFTTISKSIVEKNKRDTKLICLKNETGSTAYGVQLWIDNTSVNCVSNIIMAAVAPALDACSNPFFEQIPSSDALPYQATLVACNGQENAINVGDMISGAVIGIWLSRNIIAAKFPTINNATDGTSCAAIQALEDAMENPITEDDSNLVISWSLSPTTTSTTTLAPTTTTTTTT